MVFIDINTYILTEDMSFKIFLKKNMMQLFLTVVTYLLKNVEHGIEHDIDIAYGIYIYTLDISEL